MAAILSRGQCVKLIRAVFTYGKHDNQRIDLYT